MSVCIIHVAILKREKEQLGCDLYRIICIKRSKRLAVGGKLFCICGGSILELGYLLGLASQLWLERGLRQVLRRLSPQLFIFKSIMFNI